MKRRADEDPNLVTEVDERLKKKRKKRERSEMKKRADEDPNLVIEKSERLKKKRKKKLKRGRYTMKIRAYGRLMKKRKKKLKEEDDEREIGWGNLNGDLMFEVLKHLDPKTLATAACVNKNWSEMAKDDRLWEFIWTSRWANMGITFSSLPKFRSHVLDNGGFRRFHSRYVSDMCKYTPSSSIALSRLVRHGLYTPVSHRIYTPVSLRGFVVTSLLFNFYDSDTEYTEDSDDDV